LIHKFYVFIPFNSEFLCVKSVISDTLQNCIVKDMSGIYSQAETSVLPLLLYNQALFYRQT